MISKEQFIKYLDYIKQAQEKEDKIDNFIREISIEGYCYILSDEIYHMIEMLCSCMDIEYCSDDTFGDDIQYFIYDLEWGKRWTPGCYTDSEGNDVDISTPEKLYDYLTKDIEVE